MTPMSVSEMRKIEGGIPWMFIVQGAAGLAAYARYIYEHSKLGRHVTNYGWLGLKYSLYAGRIAGHIAAGDPPRVSCPVAPR